MNVHRVLLYSLFVLIILLLRCNKIHDNDIYLIDLDDKWCYINNDGSIKYFVDDAWAEEFIGNFAILNYKDYSTIIDKSFKRISDLKFDRVCNEHDKFVSGAIDREFYRIDKSNFRVSKYPYLIESKWNSNCFTAVDTNYKTGLVDSNGTPISEFIYDQIVFPRDIDIKIYPLINKEIGRFEKGKKYGYITQEGRILSKELFEYAFLFENDRSIVKLNGKIGLINNHGDWIIEPKYDCLVSDNLISRIDNNNPTGLISWPYIHYFQYLRLIPDFPLPVMKDNKWGFINLDGKVIIELKYDHVSEFREGFSAVSVDGMNYLINDKGNVKLFLDFDELSPPSNGICKFKRHGYEGFVSINGNVLLDSLDKVSTFENNYGIYMKNRKYGVIDRDGKVIVTNKYDLIFKNGINFHTGMQYSKFYYFFSKDKKTGHFDENFNITFSLDKYDEIQMTPFELMPFKKNNKYGCVDSNGHIVLPAIYNDLDILNCGLFKVKKNNKKYVLNKDGKEILEY